MNGGGPRQEVDKERAKAQMLPSSHWTLTVVFVSLLVDLLGFTVILPLMPSLLEYYSQHDEVVNPRLKVDVLHIIVDLAGL